MRVEITDALFEMLNFVSEHSYVSQTKYASMFTDNDELFDAIEQAFYHLEPQEQFYLGYHLGFCPWCLSKTPSYSIKFLQKNQNPFKTDVKKAIDSACTNMDMYIKKQRKNGGNNKCVN